MRFLFRSCLPALLFLIAPGAHAQTEIHRCTQDDGTISFQETPCEENADDAAESANGASTASAAGAESADTNREATNSAAEDSFDFSSPFDNPAEMAAAPAPDLPEPISRDRETCEKSTRDAIDAIDLEMRKGFSKEQGQVYKAELLELTRQLRACKQL